MKRVIVSVLVILSLLSFADNLFAKKKTNSSNAFDAKNSNFFQFFGIRNEQDNKTINTQTSGNWTKDRARTVTGGQAQGMFSAPPLALEKFRGTGIKKENFSGQSGILQYWLEAPGRVNVHQRFSFGPWARYGKITKAMTWDVEGYVIGGYTKTTKQKAQYKGSYRQIIEEWDKEISAWKVISDRANASGGKAGFDREGIFRVSIGIKNTLFRKAPKYFTVMVVDPSKNRAGKEIIHKIKVKCPGKAIGGITIYGKKIKTKRKVGNCFLPMPGQYRFLASAQKAKVKWEVNGSRATKATGDFKPYRMANWILRDNRSGVILETLKNKEAYSFDADHWRDGSYRLEAHLDSGDQGHSITSMTVKPDIVYIKVYDCGEGKYEELTFPNVSSTDSKPPEKKIVDLDLGTTPPLATLDGGLDDIKFIVPPGLKIVDGMNHPGDTPDVPVKFDACSHILQQIRHRTKQLQKGSDRPFKLMQELFRNPEKYSKLEKEYHQAWNDFVKKVKKSREPFKPLSLQYTKLIMLANQNRLVVSEADQKKYRPMQKDGSPSIIGRGIPLGFFVFGKKQIELAKKLKNQQKDLYTKWMKTRNALKAELPKLKKELEVVNKKQEKLYKRLIEIKSTHDSAKQTLADLYYSGQYEHCLGKSSALSMSGGGAIDGSAKALPGMNIEIPQPQQLIPGQIDMSVPKPLHKIQNLKLKEDGSRQLKQDRKLLMSLVEAKRLKYMAESGTWSNWLGNKALWLLKPTGLDQVIINTAAGKSCKEIIADSASVLGERYSTVGRFLKRQVAEKSINQLSDDNMKLFDAIGKAVKGMPEAFQMQYAQAIRVHLDVMPQLEKTYDRLLKLGDSTQDDQKALAILTEQDRLWDDVEEGKSAIEGVILDIATANCLKGIGKSASGKVLTKYGGSALSKTAQTQAKNAISKFLAKTSKYSGKLQSAGRKAMIETAQNALNKELKNIGGSAAVEFGKKQILQDTIKRTIKENLERTSELAASEGKRKALEIKLKNVEKMVKNGKLPKEAGEKLIQSMKNQIDSADEFKRAVNNLNESFAKDIENVTKIKDKVKKASKDLDADQKQLSKKMDEGLNNYRKIVDGKLPSKEPIKTGQVIKNDELGRELGSGGVGEVFEYKINGSDDLVAKKFKNRDPDIRQAQLDDEVKGFKIMRELGIPHNEAVGTGVIRKPGLFGETDEVHALIKKRYKANELPIDELIKKRSKIRKLQGWNKSNLTRLEQIEMLDYYHRASSKGVIFADPNPGNLLKKADGTGGISFSAGEGGSVFKITNSGQLTQEVGNTSLLPESAGKVLSPELARKVQSALLTVDTGIINPKNHFDVLQASNKLVEELTPAMGKEAAEKVIADIVNTGFSFKELNIGNHIDSDILNAFKSPETWAKTRSSIRKAAVLKNADKYIGVGAKESLETLNKSINKSKNAVKLLEKQKANIINAVTPDYNSKMGQLLNSSRKATQDAINSVNDELIKTISSKNTGFIGNSMGTKLKVFNDIGSQIKSSDNRRIK